MKIKDFAVAMGVVVPLAYVEVTPIPCGHRHHHEASTQVAGWTSASIKPTLASVVSRTIAGR